MAIALGHRFTVREGRIGQVLIGFMIAGFVALLAAGVAGAWVTSEFQRHNEAVAHTYEVELAVADTRRLIEQGETTRRGYLLSPDTPGFLRAYREASNALPQSIGRLQRLTADNPRQRTSIRALTERTRDLLQRREQTLALVGEGRTAAAVALFRRELSAERLRAIRGVFDAMTREERRLLLERDAEQQRSIMLFYVVLAAAGVLLLLVAIAALLIVLRYTADLGRSRADLQQLNESLEAIVQERTSDLTRANDEIQRFAYIVSHDLRSPLVNVMGFTAELETATTALRDLVDRTEAESPALLTEDARLAAREDLPEAIGFIRTSTQKMDRLINAILALSRQGRRVLAPERLDLAQLVGGIRDSIAHRLDEQGATVTAEGKLPDIVSDRVAIEQILSNLIENAVKYRHPDRPVAVRVSGGATGDRAWIAVSDNGRGIDPRDHERVFDLFRRSGTQDQPGEGIGLAHVRALAYRLGGTITLRSALGEGATFSLSLPTTLSIQEKP
ncbi:sensor histidine kinase [Sphingomonas radiodurans]|uniref:sensor histidine kinase n=1 Tax=Sphingomonas radiodurans TaxID=2890321 RepID=UPI001E2B5EA1|nr:sensor histidine kinase [Sphingomonas radiodurans]WBH17699.1 CHASE3 domain-containing protein [Sphingomonas radiodurans]